MAWWMIIWMKKIPPNWLTVAYSGLNPQIVFLIKSHKSKTIKRHACTWNFAFGLELTNISFGCTRRKNCSIQNELDCVVIIKWMTWNYPKSLFLVWPLTIDHSKNDGGVSILPRPFAKSRFRMFKNRLIFWGIKILKSKVLSNKTYVDESNISQLVLSII